MDYCHKIRSYFHGETQQSDQVLDKQDLTTYRTSMVDAMTPVRNKPEDISMDTDLNVSAFRLLGGLID